MKLIAVGDNVTDLYIDHNVYYPGGNAVNVAVNCKRNGMDEVAYIGVFGDDENARHLKSCLDLEKIDYSRSRTAYGETRIPRVNLNEEGDRVFAGGNPNSVQHILRLGLTSDDLEYIAAFDTCHTSCFSRIESELERLQKACDVSFDFSELRYHREGYLESVCPYVKYAFFSGTQMTRRDIDTLFSRCHAMGTDVVGVTLGSHGAVFSQNGKVYTQGIKPVQAVDTMGAGDSFIAGFLTEFLRSGGDMPNSLDYAADRAANTCTISGAFGYPHKA